MLPNRPSGVAFDGADIFVSDFNATGGSVQILKVNSTTLAEISSFAVPLPGGQEGFDALGYNSNIQKLFGSTWSNTSPASNFIVEFTRAGVAEPAKKMQV